MPPGLLSLAERQDLDRKAKCLRTISSLGTTQLRNLLSSFPNKACNEGQLGWFETLLDVTTLSTPIDESTSLEQPVIDHSFKRTQQEQRDRQSETSEQVTTSRKRVREVEAVEIKEEDGDGEQEDLVRENIEQPVENEHEIGDSTNQVGLAVTVALAGISPTTANDSEPTRTKRKRPIHLDVEDRAEQQTELKNMHSDSAAKKDASSADMTHIEAPSTATVPASIEEAQSVGSASQSIISNESSQKTRKKKSLFRMLELAPEKHKIASADLFGDNPGLGQSVSHEEPSSSRINPTNSSASTPRTKKSNKTFQPDIQPIQAAEGLEKSSTLATKPRPLVEPSPPYHEKSAQVDKEPSSWAAQRSARPTLRPSVGKTSQSLRATIAPHGIDISGIKDEPYLTIICGDLTSPHNMVSAIEISRDLLKRFSPTFDKLDKPVKLITATKGNIGFTHMQKVSDFIVEQTNRWLTGSELSFRAEDPDNVRLERLSLVRLSSCAHIFDIVELQNGVMAILWRLYVEEDVSLTPKDLDNMWKTTLEGCPARKLLVRRASNQLIAMEKDAARKEEYESFIRNTSRSEKADDWYSGVMKWRKHRPGLLKRLAESKDEVFQNEQVPSWNHHSTMKIVRSDPRKEIMSNFLAKRAERKRVEAELGGTPDA